MGGAIFFSILMIGSIILIVAISAWSAKEKRLKWLAAAADFLGGQHDHSNRAWGTKLGPTVTFELATRGAGSSAEHWTHIGVEISKKYPLAVHVRRHGKADHGQVARGEMVDVQVGDKAFDDAFLVEAAPADVVRVLLEADIRALLAAYPEIDLDTVDRADGTRALVVGIRGWLEDPAEFAEPMRVMARLGSRVRAAYAAADAAVEQNTAPGDPYRPIVDDAPVRAAQSAREAEVANVKGMRAERDARAKTFATVLVAVVFAVIALGLCATLPR